VFLRYNRFTFPKFQKALWDMQLNKDVILIKGMRRGGFGTSIHVEKMWVIAPDEEPTEVEIDNDWTSGF
jgi:hypothetical protein